MRRRALLSSLAALVALALVPVPVLGATWTGNPYPPGKKRPCNARFCDWYLQCASGEARCTHRAFGGR